MILTVQMKGHQLTSQVQSQKLKNLLVKTNCKFTSLDQISQIHNQKSKIKERAINFDMNEM